MTNYDSFSYDIRSRLPEWWKDDKLAASINDYTQDLIAEILQALLSSTGVVQPLNVWKSIPEEYHWYHHYQSIDDYLSYETKDKSKYIDNPTCILYGGDTLIARVPNTKRKCHAKIKLKLKGGELSDTLDDNIHDKTNKTIIDELVFSNAGRDVTLHNIPNVSTIEISTEDNKILIDGEDSGYLIEGEFNKIEPTIKYADYKYPDTHQNIPLEDENKETFFTIKTTNTINFELEVYLLKPTYTTEQNIKIATVSAFPIEQVDLYGYFCHPFNNKEGYKHLWSKHYEQDKRTVYDRITKQFDCERFYIEVKFYGIDTPLKKGFPQEPLASNEAFQTNPMLDKWGKIYGIQRREFTKEVTEDDEPYTFPKYYPYDIEQDYWYEQRMVNEYRFNDEAINSYFIKDSDFNNIASLECIYPFMNDIWVYTETIDPDNDTQHKLEITGKNLCKIEELDTDGVSWENPDNLLIDKPIDMITLNPNNNKIKKLNDFSYQTKKLKLSFCLTPFDNDMPKDVDIKGIELVFKSKHDIRSNSVTLTPDSYILIPHGFDDEPDKITINDDFYHWKRNAQYYIIGGETSLFQEEKITREQLFNDNNGFLEFEIGFINESDYLEALLTIEEISLNIYYEIIPDEYSIDAEFNTMTLIEGEEETLLLDIILTNESDKKIKDKEVYIIIPPEFQLESPGSYYFDLDTEEEKVIKIEGIKITPIKENNHLRTGLYDILIASEDKIVSKEILVRNKL